MGALHRHRGSLAEAMSSMVGLVEVSEVEGTALEVVGKMDTEVAIEGGEEVAVLVVEALMGGWAGKDYRVENGEEERECLMDLGEVTGEGAEGTEDPITGGIQSWLW